MKILTINRLSKLKKIQSKLTLFRCSNNFVLFSLEIEANLFSSFPSEISRQSLIILLEKHVQSIMKSPKAILKMP